MEKRFRMVFDGWASQFENMPAWRPEIKIENNIIFLDGKPLNLTTEKPVSISIEANKISVVLLDEVSSAERKVIIILDWPFSSEPYIRSIDQNGGASPLLWP